MSYKTSKYFFIFLFALFLISSCKKKTEANIVGIWRQISVTFYEDNSLSDTELDLKKQALYSFWFENNDIVIYSDIVEKGKVTRRVRDKGNYQIKFRFSKPLVVLDLEGKDLDYNMTWEILKLEEDILVLVNAAKESKKTNYVGVVMMEFIRKQ